MLNETLSKKKKEKKAEGSLSWPLSIECSGEHLFANSHHKDLNENNWLNSILPNFNVVKLMFS